ncbi:MAG: hypothetical protein HYT71_03375 [Candidatus Aenigmarchaeota archaeon]|nr:hypothetical protein [Candidatus Aenigmarchaeota archaeon]
MNTIIEKNKQELIDSINGMREDLGEQPYEMEYLSNLSMEELQKMVDDMFGQKQGKLELEVGQREKIRTEFYRNITLGFLFVVIMLMLIFTVSGLFIR